VSDGLTGEPALSGLGNPTGTPDGVACLAEDRRLAVKRVFALSILTILTLMPVAFAGNTSSNSSSNSSNGVHTRVDTIVTDDDRGRTVYVRRSVRIDNGDRRSTYMRDTIREREPYGRRKMRRWHLAHDDDD
jgi:hypothetical protein